jgi:hypothetical protein
VVDRGLNDGLTVVDSIPEKFTLSIKLVEGFSARLYTLYNPYKLDSVEQLLIHLRD